MKLEPVRRRKLPNYAAALALLTAVPMLSACGVLQSDGQTVVSTEPEYDGEVFVNEEPSPAEAFAQQSRDVLLQAARNAGLDTEFIPEGAGDFDTVLYHNRWTAVGLREWKQLIFVCFFDGAESADTDECEDSVPDCNNLADWHAHFAKQTFDWGFADIYDPQDYIGSEAFRMAFVDMSKFDTLTEEDAQQILSDLLGMDNAQGEEDSP